MTPQRRTFATRLLSAACLAALAPLAALPGHALAQDYPSKPVRFVIAQAAGGGSDTIGRLVARKLSDQMGQPVVVENRPGAAGMLGAVAVKQSPPDGYTILLGAIDTITAPLVSRNPPYDPLADFAPVTQLTSSPNVWVVNPEFPARSMKELVDRARATPDKIDYASSGVGSMQHLAGELLTRMAAVRMTHVPYKGGPPAFTDVISGRIPAMVSGMQGALPNIRAGKVRALAVTGKQRLASLPDVPTVGEALGLPAYEALNWQALFLPAGTPRPIVERVAQEVRKALADPETRDRVVGLAYDPIANTPAEFAAVMQAEHRRWSETIRAANIVVD
jgi:tripartite-type tricarboxylate transporter receptor subunit TctC